ARDGFALDASPPLRSQVEKQRELLAADPGLRAIFLTKDGQPPAPGFRIVQRDLGRTLETIAAHGWNAFYRGPVADALVAAVRAHGGVLDAADLTAYRPQWLTSLLGSTHGRTLITSPPPGSGGIVLEALGILAREDPQTADPESAGWLRPLAGAMAQAFTDRARFYGDPAFTSVPVDTLLARPRLARIAAALRAGHCSPVDTDAAADGGTGNVSVVDGEGDAVVLTTTINYPFGAGFMVPRTGIILNDEMDDFALAAGVPNVYGLVGEAPNAVAPGKRPQSSMSPTIVVDGARPELAAGASGGPLIISGVLQVLLHVVAFGNDLDAEVAAPRIHDQGVPPVLLVEPAVPDAARQALARWCHPVHVMPNLGAVSAAGIGRDGTLHAAGDPRKDGGAAIVR